MAPPIPSASIELDYPLYALDFDPQDANRLVVGGGGGAGRSGVGNKITVLQTATPQDLRIAGDVELSRDEDSVMSLANGPHRGKTAYVYAGINSSPASIAKGKNEHLRTLAIDQSKARASVGAKTPDARIAELSRSAMFTDPEADTYQRVLRVAGAVGAAATAMGSEPQLAVFDTAGASPQVRGVMELPREIEDLDVIQRGDNDYQIVFCYKYDLYVLDIGKENGEPELIYTIPIDEPERPVYRSVRYLSPGFVLAVANMPKRNGIILQGLRLPTTDQQKARIAVTARINRKISATAMSVRNLAPPASPDLPIGDTEFVVAIAGNDSSISLYTVQHKTSTALTLLYHLHPFYTLKDVHGSDNITGLAFSHFVTPKTHIRPQFVKLASISLQKTVAVHSIPLKKFVDPAPRNRKGPPRTVRYVVALKSKGPSPRPVIIILSVMILIMAIVGQTIREMYSDTRPILHIHKILPSWHGTLRTPDHPPAAFLVDEFLSKLSGDKTVAAGETLVIREGDAPPATAGGDQESNTIQVDIHDAGVHGPGKTWEELGAEQKEAWKERLGEAGAWTQGMGESVFQGILFGEMAGAVGRAMAG